jgi:hypothetical protein
MAEERGVNELLEFPECSCWRKNGYHADDCTFEVFCRNHPAGKIWYKRVASIYVGGGTTSLKRGGITALAWALDHLDELVEFKMKQLAAAKKALTSAPEDGGEEDGIQ